MGYLLLGLLFAIGPLFWRTDIGGQLLTPAQAWDTGFSKICVAMGVVLLVLAALLWRGMVWPRWLVVLWCPANILLGIGWSAATGIGQVDPVEIVLIGAPVVLFWVWATRRDLFPRAR